MSMHQKSEDEFSTVRDDFRVHVRRVKLEAQPEPIDLTRGMGPLPDGQEYVKPLMRGLGSLMQAGYAAKPESSETFEIVMTDTTTKTEQRLMITGANLDTLWSVVCAVRHSDDLHGRGIIRFPGPIG